MNATRTPSTLAVPRLPDDAAYRHAVDIGMSVREFRAAYRSVAVQLLGDVAERQAVHRKIRRDLGIDASMRSPRQRKRLAESFDGGDWNDLQAALNANRKERGERGNIGLDEYATVVNHEMGTREFFTGDRDAAGDEAGCPQALMEFLRQPVPMLDAEAIARAVAEQYHEASGGGDGREPDDNADVSFDPAEFSAPAPAVPKRSALAACLTDEGPPAPSLWQPYGPRPKRPDPNEAIITPRPSAAMLAPRQPARTDAELALRRRRRVLGTFKGSMAERLLRADRPAPAADAVESTAAEGPSWACRLATWYGVPTVRKVAWTVAAALFGVPFLCGFAAALLGY